MKTDIEFKIGDIVRYIGEETPDWYGFTGIIERENNISRVLNDRVPVFWYNTKRSDCPYRYNLEKIVKEWDE